MTWYKIQKAFLFALTVALSMALAMGCNGPSTGTTPPTTVRWTGTTVDYVYKIFNKSDPNTKMTSDKLAKVAANVTSVFFASSDNSSVFVFDGNEWKDPVDNFSASTGVPAKTGVISSLSATDTGAFASIEVSAGANGVAFIRNDGLQTVAWEWAMGRPQVPKARVLLVHAFDQDGQKRLAVSFAAEPYLAVMLESADGNTTPLFVNPQKFVRAFKDNNFRIDISNSSGMMLVNDKLSIAKDGKIYQVQGYKADPNNIKMVLEPHDDTWGTENTIITSLANYQGKLAIGFSAAGVATKGGFAICDLGAAAAPKCGTEKSRKVGTTVNGMAVDGPKLYMATDKGLYIYDGTDVLEFTAADPKAGQADAADKKYTNTGSLPSDNLKGVAMQGHTIWIATANAGAVSLTISEKP